MGGEVADELLSPNAHLALVNLLILNRAVQLTDVGNRVIFQHIA